MAYFCRGLLWWAIQAGVFGAVGADTIGSAYSNSSRQVNGPVLTRHILSTTASTSSATTEVDTYTWSPLPEPAAASTTSSPPTYSTITLSRTRPSPSSTTTKIPGNGGVLTDLPPSPPPIPSGAAEPPSTVVSPTVSLYTSYSSANSSNTTSTWSSGRYTNSSSTTLSTSTAPYNNSTSTVGFVTTIFPSSFTFPAEPCTTLAPGQDVTSWIILPNTTTITLTQIGNQTTFLLFSTPEPEFIPPTYCPTPTFSPFPSTVPAGESSSIRPTTMTAPLILPSAPHRTTTVITTSKNPPTVITTHSIPNYNGNTDKQSVEGSTYTDTYIWTPLPDPGPRTTSLHLIPTPLPDDGQRPGGDQPPATTVWNGDGSAPTPVTQTVGSVTVIVATTQVIIGQQTVPIGSGQKTITEGGNVFTVGPSQVVGPFLIINVPTKAGGQFVQTPAPTTVQGVPISFGPSVVVVGGTSFAIGPAAPQTTITQNGQTFTIGPAGIAFSGTTITPPASLPTNVVIVDGQIFSAVGSNTAVIGGRTIVYGPNIAATTEVFNGETITVGPQGVSFDGTTLGGRAQATGTQLGLAGGLSVTEVGSSLAIIEGQTFTLGPGAPMTTTVIDGESITAGPSGLTVGGATLTYPFNLPTQAITAGGITFTEIGSTLAVIGSKTFTFGPGSTATTTVFDGQTISIGPGGIGFSSTTFTAAPTGATGKTKNGAERNSIRGAVLGASFMIGVAFWL